MDDFIEHIRSKNLLLDQRMEERREKWNVFWHCFSSYDSVLRIGSRPIISPVMTVERYKEMQVLRKQACISEVRQKTKSREKEFLNRVERSLEEIQRETSEKEMSLRLETNSLESSHFTETFDHMLQSNNNSSVVDTDSNTAGVDTDSNTAGVDTDSNTAGVDTDSTIPGETIHLQPARSMKVSRASSRRSSQSSRKDSTSTHASTHTSDSEDPRALIVRAAKIHRRRRESGGSTGSDVSVSPSEVGRHRSRSHSSVSSEPARIETKESGPGSEHLAVRRTGSDSCCKLRRSGSERALKRSGSDRVLRRTGSGDIPTAIMSDCTPTPSMHRRAGSGDMSYLHSNKESPINKLTRSYDMSIRSLMSEELNVRVPPSAVIAKENANNEQQVEHLPPGHNLLLSPKYNGGSKDSTAVKLLTRPATPTLKKQTSPSKESGPPQPVKAIHTLPPSLPPSLPTSRENTFDSLPLKSPQGSDSEVKDDKHINILAESVEPPINKARSSYHRRSASPHRAMSSPHKREPSPQRIWMGRTDGASLSKNLMELKADKKQCLSSSAASDSVIEGAEASPTAKESEQADTQSSGVSHTKQPDTQSSGVSHTKHADTQSSGVSHTKQADAVSETSIEEDISGKLANAVAFMGTNCYSSEKEDECKANSAGIWNLSHGGSAPDSPDFLHLPPKLATSTESLAQQWLVDKVSQLHSSGQVNIEDWLQNAPDSVKQKLSQLLPRGRQTERLEHSTETHSPLDLSIDDTLRSTSPIPDSENFPLIVAQTPVLAVSDVVGPFVAANTDGVPSPVSVVSDKVSPSPAVVIDRAPSPAMAVTDEVDTSAFEHGTVQDSARITDKPTPLFNRSDSARITDKPTPLFNRSDSYTLDKPSVALLLADKANHLNASRESPSPMKFFPSPDMSSSLPVTHNRVEAKASHPTNASSVEPSSQAHSDQVPQWAITRPLSHTGKDLSPTSTSAIERKKAFSSKSYIVEKPSAALLHSLNESQKSAIESAVSSVSAKAADQLSVESEDTLKQSLSGSPSVPAKPGVQRKLNYLNLGNLSTNIESSEAAYHSLKYDSADVPKKAHLQRYLQQLKYADVPGRKEAWAESPNKSSNSQSNPRSPAGSTSPDSDQDCRLPARDPSCRPTKVTKQSGKVVAGRRKSSPTIKQPESSEEVFCRVRRDLTLLKSKYSKKLSPRGSSNQRPSSAEPATVTKRESKEKEYRPSTAAGHTSSSLNHRHAGTNEHLTFGSTDKNLAQLKERLHAVSSKQSALSSHVVKSFAEKEATPVSTGYAPPTVDESTSDYSSYGAIHSISHPRPSTALSSAHNTPSHVLPPSSGSGAILAAHIRGHLCRRLLATCKVQSIVKTIRDCRSLLPPCAGQPMAAQTTLSLHDLNFQQRLLDQWQAALLDIHEIFFELPLDKRIALIHQSEVMEAKAKSQQQKSKAKVVRKTSNKEQQPPKRRVSQTTQKVIERRKLQKASADTSAGSKCPPATTLRKAVLAPTFAANSPKRYTSTPASSGRATFSHVTHGPTRKSREQLSRAASRV